MPVKDQPTSALETDPIGILAELEADQAAERDLLTEIAAAEQWLATLNEKRLRMYQLAIMRGQGMNEAEALIAARECCEGDFTSDETTETKAGVESKAADAVSDKPDRSLELARAFAKVTGLDLATLADYIDNGAFDLELDEYADRILGALAGEKTLRQLYDCESRRWRARCGLAETKLFAIQAIVAIKPG